MREAQVVLENREVIDQVIGRSDEPCVASETCVLNDCKMLKMQRAGYSHSRQRKRRANLQLQSQKRVQAEI